MDDFELLVDLHCGQGRQGPGSDAATRQALALAGLAGGPLTVADLGCGTGASTAVLASELSGVIHPVDLFPDFLTALAARMLAHSDVRPLAASMDALPFDDAALDLIWSEGAIYNIGFDQGIATWRRFLKPGGVLAVSELTWWTETRPDEVTDHWRTAYPGVATAGEKLRALEQAGFAPIGYFPLPATCWGAEYYAPLQAAFDGFLARQNHSDPAQAIVAEERAEIDFYRRFGQYYGYGFYIARRTAA